LETPVSELPGVSAHRAECYARLGIVTVSDLLRHLPMRYEQEWAESTIEDLPVEALGSARGMVTKTNIRRGRTPRFEALLEDQHQDLQLVWFNASYLRDQIQPGMMIRVQGKAHAYKGRPQMVNPRWERLDEQGAAPAKDQRLRPIYPSTENLPGWQIENLIGDLLPRVTDQLIDPLSSVFVREREMPALADALRLAHQPRHEQEFAVARRRLAYNELLLLQLGIAIKRHYNHHVLAAPTLRYSTAIDQHIRARFPFELTDAQSEVVAEIAADLQRAWPMNRLLQGDVGSGKTVVALYALLMAVCERRQGALMAPTELLAEQHWLSITDMLKGSSVRIELLTAGTSAAGSAERRAQLKKIDAGEVDIVIGTQALLSESVQFNKLAVVVVDEQHRFGVLQRASFRGHGEGKTKKAHSPHYLVMTATPIPRTLSLTVFGDLDVSTIRKSPPGRAPIVTRVVGPDKANDVYDYLAQRVADGGQAYVVVPAIDESGHESRAQLKNVRAHAAALRDKLRGFKVAAIHGQLKRQTRESIMHRFRKGLIHVLVATTVIEVGVDVPGATMMIVEHAERYGLAQLHQLRGRIGRGRGGPRSVCVFIADPSKPEAQQRMDAIGSTGDGFRIAERDLEIRGMGDLFGTRQHGMPPLRVARIVEDMDLLQMARRDAEAMIDKDPGLTAPTNRTLRNILLREYGEAIALIDVG